MPIFEAESGGKTYEVDAPDLNTAIDSLSKLTGGQTSTAADIAKSGGIGVVKGGIGLAGMGGDISALAGKASGWLAGKLGGDPATAEALTRAMSPFGMGTAPTSGELQSKIEQVTGKFYEPKTTAGQYAQTIGEFLPAAVGGPEGLAGRVLTRTVVPAVASEAAGQATKGTAAEPYARPIAAVAAGGFAGIRRAPQQATPTLEDLQNARNADYAAAHDLGISVTPVALQREAGAIRADLSNQGITGRTAPKTTAILDDLASKRGAQSLADIDNHRKELGVISRGTASPDPLVRTDAAAARQAINGIDDFLPRLAPTDLATGAGNLSRATQFLESARGNAAAGFRLQALDRAEYRAGLNASAANSGANYENALRQQVKQILTRGAPGYSADERAAMERLVRGEGTRNVVRTAGNLLGGGGGLGAVVAAGAGHLALPGLGVAAPAVGYALKRAGNAATERAFNQLSQTIAGRSPLGAAYPRALPAPRLDPRIVALQQALVSRPGISSSGLLAPLTQ